MSNTLDDFNQIRRKVNKDYGSKNVVSFDFGVKKKTMQSESQAKVKPQVVSQPRVANHSEVTAQSRNMARLGVTAQPRNAVRPRATTQSRTVDEPEVAIQSRAVNKPKKIVESQISEKKMQDEQITKKTEESSQTVMSDLAEELSEIPEVPNTPQMKSTQTAKESEDGSKKKDKTKKSSMEKKRLMVIIAGVFSLVLMIVAIVLNIPSSNSGDDENSYEDGQISEEFQPSSALNEDVALPLQHNALEDENNGNEALDKDVKVSIGEFEQVESDVGARGAVQVLVSNLTDQTISAAIEVTAKDDGGNVLDFASLYAECMEPRAESLSFQAFLASELTSEQLKSAKIEVSKVSLYTPPNGGCEN